MTTNYNEPLQGYISQEYDPLNDVALNDDWAIPNLVMGGVGLFNGSRAVLNLLPYKNDIWQGRNLLFHKPFWMMNKADKNKYENLGETFYKNVLHPQFSSNPLVKNGKNIGFPNSKKGKPYYEYMEQYPLLRYQIDNAKSNQPMAVNKNREDANLFYNLKGKWKGKDYDYQIRDNTNNSLEFHNIKPYEFLERDIEKAKNKGEILYELLTK